MVIPHDVNKHQRCEISQLAGECFVYLSSVNRVGVYLRFRYAVIKMTGIVFMLALKNHLCPEASGHLLLKGEMKQD